MSIEKYADSPMAAEVPLIERLVRLEENVRKLEVELSEARDDIRANSRDLDRVLGPRPKVERY